MALLAQACVLGLHAHVGQTLELVREALAADAAFDGLAMATAQLGPALGVARAARGPPARRPARRCCAQPMRGRSTSAASSRGRSASRPQRWARWSRCASCSSARPGRVWTPSCSGRWCSGCEASHDVALVRGGAAGLAYSSGRTDSAGLARSVAGHLSGTSTAADAVGFLRGLLQTAREAAWQERGLLASIDGRLASWDAETFIAHLPELRLAFAAMTPHETDRIARAVARTARRGGAGRGCSCATSTRSRWPRHLAVSRAAAALLARDGLAGLGGERVSGVDRWRLVLGRYAARSLGAAAPGSDERPGWRQPSTSSTAASTRGAGCGPTTSDRDGSEDSQPHLVTWLGEVRELFPRETAEVVEKHALDRYGLIELVTDPQTLERLEPSEQLLKTLLALSGHLDDEVLVVARRIIRQVVEELRRASRSTCAAR